MVHDRRRRGLAGSVLTWCEPAGDTPGSPWLRDGLFALDTLLATSDPTPLFALRARRPEPGAGVPALLRALFPKPLVQDGLEDTSSALRAELARLDRHAQHTLLQALVRDESAASLNQPDTAPSRWTGRSGTSGNNSSHSSNCVPRLHGQ
ncbi:hypothetical protein [Streptomyces rubradiris]|uniref:hypothetical protein n=1 Tax=Streptomyces rubradiris TaxID=285531 RepID=UPI0019423887|nr:hypothetical protein [Streptomyces rubradiris]